MKKLRIFEQNYGEKNLIDVINKEDLHDFIDSYKKKIKERYPEYSYLSFQIESVEIQEHIVIFKINYTFKNSSYFSRKMLTEYHTLLLKEIEE